MALPECTSSSLLRSPVVTKGSRRRMVPLLAGLGVGALVAVVAVVVGPRAEPAAPPTFAPDVTNEPQAGGPMPFGPLFDDASTAPPPPSPLLLPLPIPPPVPLPPPIPVP